MKLTFVEKLPDRARGYKHLQELIDDFCNNDAKVVKVEFTSQEYVSAESCYNAWHKAIKRSKRPVKVTMRNKEVYLVKII